MFRINFEFCVHVSGKRQQRSITDMFQVVPKKSSSLPSQSSSSSTSIRADVEVCVNPPVTATFPLKQEQQTQEEGEDTFDGKKLLPELDVKKETSSPMNDVDSSILDDRNTATSLPASRRVNECLDSAAKNSLEKNSNTDDSLKKNEGIASEYKLGGSSGDTACDQSKSPNMSHGLSNASSKLTKMDSAMSIDGVTVCDDDGEMTNESSVCENGDKADEKKKQSNCDDSFKSDTCIKEIASLHIEGGGGTEESHSLNASPAMEEGRSGGVESCSVDASLLIKGGGGDKPCSVDDVSWDWDERCEEFEGFPAAKKAKLHHSDRY